MTSKDKDKENKGLQDRLRNIFKKSKDKGTYKTREFALTDDIKKELVRESPLNVRLKTIKELYEVVTNNQLDEASIAKLYDCTQDLLKHSSLEVRNTTFTFLQCLVKGQIERLGIIRSHIFKIIKEHEQDVAARFELLQSLTDNGKEILYFEEEIGPFLLYWLPEISSAGKIDKFMFLLDTVIKYNASYIEEDVITGFVHHICLICCGTNQETVVRSCLQIFETIVAYSSLPPDSLPEFIGTLCRTVNREAYSMFSWNITRKLLGTHMGHSSLLMLCSILREPSLRSDVSLIRGAVFYVYMALWGKHLVPTLRCPPSAVLPSILQAVKNLEPLVTYEVITAVQSLINYTNSSRKLGTGLELMEPTWDTILSILLIVIQQTKQDSNEALLPMIRALLQDTLNMIESLIEAGNFNGSIKRFYEIIEECSKMRQEGSVLRLINYLSKKIVPTKHLWLTNLYNLLQRYFKQETRTNVRLKVLEVLSDVVTLNREDYEDELIDRIVIPYLVNIRNDPDVVVRSSSAQLLISLCMDCESKRFIEMVDILEKLLNRPFEEHLHDSQPIREPLIFDVNTVVTGLIQIFTVKIHKLPSLHAAKVYEMLVKFLEMHYGKPTLFENCTQIRYKIFECFLKMRADHMYHLGCTDANGKLRFSSYLCVTYSKEKNAMTSPPPSSPAILQQPQCTVTYIPLNRAYNVFITCFKLEKDIDVVTLLLKELPNVLQNKSIILTKQGNSEMHLLVNELSSMLLTNLPINDTTKLTRLDYKALVLTALSYLASYHAYLDNISQQKMIRTLYKSGFTLKCYKQAITALTTCTLEMRDVMVKILPDVLLSLSKISAMERIAIPVLEFLSTLTVLPMVFTNFVADEYMAVFAISLPYTNPFKYNHYIVSLAHHVIAVWFLKCRLPFRRDFVKFITQGLQTNALIPFEENQDSSDRKRSSSLTEPSSRHPTRSAPIVRRPDIKHTIDPSKKNLVTFYEELTETCIDLMARYAFSPCSAQPKRLPTADFLLSGGQSMSWLLGNKVITITTSGCAQKALKHGLCDKCYTSCKIEARTPDDLKKATRSDSSEKDKDDSSSRVTRQNSGDKSNTNTSTSSPIDETKKLGDKLEQLPSKLQQLSVGDVHTNERQRCACWCQGWAEIHVRRPTGDMSWVMRIQNQISYQHSMYEFPLNEISALLLPSLNHTSYDFDNYEKESHSQENTSQEDECNTASVPISIPGSPNKHSPSRQNSQDNMDDDLESLYEDGSRSRNPVRRSNSSPEMSSNWKNPFMQQKQEREDARSQDDDCVKKMKNYTKDMRVSCEAIPEEIAGMGTTPPTEHNQHPSLLNSLSYPGTTPTQDPNAKPYQTVPPSPNINQTTAPPLNFQCLSKPSAGVLRSARSESTESMASEKSGERPTTLPTLANFAPLTAKPPQSPTQTSPRFARHALRDRDGYEVQKSSSLVLEKTSLSLSYKSKKTETDSLSHSDQNLSSKKRDRTHTISVMSPIRRPRLENLRQSHSSRSKETPKSGISPSFIFLQLYHAARFDNLTEKPLLVDSNEIVQRALTVLDLIPPYETHKIGVIYIGRGQCRDEVEILRNKFGSVRYMEFLQTLGTLIKLSDVDSQVVFLGGLEQNGSAGKFSYIWQDDVISVMFHVATLMPNKETDQYCNNKKMHIGNNNVTIVYNESGEEYQINTIKGQFNFACVIVQPLDHNTNKVTVKAKEELLPFIGHSEPKIISDQNVAILARQLALHANLASLVFTSLKGNNQVPYASNWLERLRKIKNLRNKILQENKKENEEISSRSRHVEDFTVYT